MKTKNNVQKAINKSFAVIIGLVLLSFTVNAQNFWKSVLENTGFSEIALAMVSTNENVYVSDANSMAVYFETEQETEIELENWMTEEANFESSYFLPETENELELENWMTTENYFERNNVTILESESRLELETWMMDNQNWEM